MHKFSKFFIKFAKFHGQLKIAHIEFSAFERMNLYF